MTTDGRLNVFTAFHLLFIVSIILLSAGSHWVSGLTIAPDFTLTDVDGNVFSLSDYRGQVVLLEFMQTHCGSCQSEARELNTVHQEFGDNIVILSISIYYQDTDDVLRSFRDHYGNEWTYAQDTINLQDVYNIVSTPTIYLIDHEGYIQYHHENGLVDASTLINEIRDIMPYPLTITTMPNLSDIHFQVNGRDYSTSSNGNVTVGLQTGQHQIELIDTLIRDNGLEYHFTSWNGDYSGSSNPLIITFTSASLLVADFEIFDITSPLADAGLNQTVYENTLVTFDGSNSFDNVGIVDYEWTFIDDTSQILSGVTATYHFVTQGVYVVTLNVSDAAGNWATDMVGITVVDESQSIVDAGRDRIVDEDTWITFNGTASWDPQGLATYTWTFIDDGPQTLHGRTPTYRFANPGHYLITLTMTDPRGTNISDTLQVTVLDITPPVVQMNGNQTVVIGTLVTVSAEGSFDNGKIARYEWDFGDGTEKTGVTSNFTYTQSGNYTVTLRVIDEEGNIGSSQITITVLKSTGNKHVFLLEKDDQLHLVVIQSCCNITGFNYAKEERAFTFEVEGSSGATGFCNITLPIRLLGDEHSIYVDNSLVTAAETRNSTHVFLYFDFSMSIHEIRILGSSGGIVNFSSLSLIFSAGVLALLSPCGFPMLPGYISYYLGRKTSVERTITGGLACTLGLIVVFSVIGIAVAVVGGFIAQYIPLLELGAGILAIIMGLSMVMDIKIPTLFTIAKAPSQKGVTGIFLYGIAYGLATLGCSAPIFFSTLFYAIASGGVLQGVLTFLVYALGMGLPLLITTVLVAKAKQLMIDRIMRWMPWFQKLSSIILVAIGIYLITYYYFTWV